MARRGHWPIGSVAVLAIAAVIAHLVSVALGAENIQIFQYWNAASLFGFGVMSYVFAFGSVYKSVSLEILLDLAQQPQHTAALAEIVDGHVANIVRRRADILVDTGLVERSGSHFAITDGGRKLSKRIACLRRAYAISDSGLYDFVTRGAAADKAAMP